ncbi:MAG: carbohydrate binding family 9 domain-containing protein [Gemmatimonadales bacterium]|nr:carbohydrate binding family 9 domain-containing protein [Gemmatimonadales bacterium]
MGTPTLLSLCALLQAQSAIVIRPPALREEAVAVATRATAPKIDGRLDDEVWSRATPAGNFRQRDPEEGAPGTEPTDVRVLYDDEALYVGVRATDAQAARISAPLARRDESPPSDWIGILIDSYFDRRTAFEFVVNPAGVKQDVYHYNDGELDPTWDAIWDVSVARDDGGWTAEFRIPWSQLRFGQGRDRRFGFNVWRKINRTGELQHWKLMTKDGRGDASRYGELTGFVNLNPPRKLEVTPYSLFGRSFEPAELGNPFRTGSSGRATLGADIRYGLTSNLTLSAALNPDFGQVEADPAVVNLSAQETFYPEKRPFFTEGSDVFRFRISASPWSNEQFFYTRRIGRAPQLSPDTRGGYASRVAQTTILGAAKVQGKTPSGWTIGALTALTAEETSSIVDAQGRPFRDVVEPRTLYGVGRLARDFRSGRTVIGAFGTIVKRDLPDRSTLLRSDALAAGLEVTHRFGGDRFVARLTTLGSRVAGSAAAISATMRGPVHFFQRPDIGYARVDSGATSLSGYGGFVEVKKETGDWLYGAQVNTRSPGLELNDAGYQNRAGRHSEMAWLVRRWLTPGALFRTASLRVNQWYDWDYDGRTADAGAELLGNMVLKNYGQWNFWGGSNRGGLDPQALRGGPGLEWPKSAWFGTSLSTDPRKSLRLAVNGNHWNNFEGIGGGTSFGAMLSWRPSGRLDLSAGPQFEQEIPSRQFIASGAVGAATEYVVGDLSQKTASLAARGNFTFSPNLTFQLYAEPFVSTGEFVTYKRVASPHAQREADRFDRLGEDRLIRNGSKVAADFNRDGTADLPLGEPNFTVLSLRSTAVLRWEYRSASTLFLVWQQERGGRSAEGRFRLGENLGDLFGSQSSNTLLLKVSHWLSIR